MVWSALQTVRDAALFRFGFAGGSERADDGIWRFVPFGLKSLEAFD